MIVVHHERVPLSASVSRLQLYGAEAVRPLQLLLSMLTGIPSSERDLNLSHRWRQRNLRLKLEEPLPVRHIDAEIFDSSGFTLLMAEGVEL